MTVSPSANGSFPRPLTEQDKFFRAIHPDLLKENGEVSSGGFSKSSCDNRMSMDWAENSTPKESYDRWEKWGNCRGLAMLTAKMCWDNHQNIYFEPIKDHPVKQDNPAHSEMVDQEPRRISDKKLRKNLARAATLLVAADESI